MERGAYCFGSTEKLATGKVGKGFMDEVSFELVFVRESGEWKMFPH